MDQQEQPNGTGPGGKGSTPTQSDMNAPARRGGLSSEPAALLAPEHRDDAGRETLAHFLQRGGSIDVLPLPQWRPHTAMPARERIGQGYASHLRTGGI